MYQPGGILFSKMAGPNGAVQPPGMEHLVARSLPKLLRRWSVMVAVITSVVTVLASPAAATTGRVPVSKHHHVAPANHRHVQVSRLPHSKRIQARHTQIHSSTALATRTRRQAVSLMNTVWDNPALSPVVLEAILAAAGRSDIAPDLLLAIAWRESRFAPTARSRLSSATGLLQFTSGTWLQAVQQFGSQYGFPEYAASIHKSQSGDYTVQGQHAREDVLALRNDPILSAALAAEVLKTQRMAMQVSIGRSTTPTDLYLVHVLGPQGTARFLAALKKRPSGPVLKIASRKVLRNAGLLARDNRVMTVAGTYKAVQTMLDDQHSHFEPVVAMASKRDLPLQTTMPDRDMSLPAHD